MHTVLVIATLLSQAPALHASASQLQAPPAPGGASLLTTSEPSDAYRPPLTRWVRVPAMALGGLVLGGAAAAGGVAGPEWLGMPRPGGGDLGPSYFQLAGGGAGALFGASAGVWGTSQLMGGHGSYGGTLLGTAAGMGAGLALLVPAVLSRNDALANTSLWLAAVLPVVGGILGHELSAPSEPRGIHVMPALSVSADGAQAGLSGHF